MPAPVPYANLSNPQTLNLYAMVGDNPETFADLDGHCSLFPGAGGKVCASSDPPQKGQPAGNDTTKSAQNQDASKWKQQVVTTIEFQKDARGAYQKFGPTAKSVDELENNVDKSLEKKWGKIEVAGTTSSSGTVEIKPDPNPYTREATARHERVHKETTQEGISKYGKDTPAFNKWWTNPQRWAADEVKAYSAGISYLEQSLRKMNDSP